MILYRNICSDKLYGFKISHNIDDNMTLDVSEGWIGEDYVNGISVTFPILPVGQNARIYLTSNSDESFAVVISRNGEDMPEVENLVLSLMDVWIPPNCDNLKELQIHTRGYDASKLDTEFDESGEPKWEIIG